MIIVVKFSETYKKFLSFEREKNDLLKYYKITELSKIYNTDMMSRYYGAKVDDIFKIKV